MHSNNVNVTQWKKSIKCTTNKNADDDVPDLMESLARYQNSNIIVAVAVLSNNFVWLRLVIQDRFLYMPLVG